MCRWKVLCDFSVDGRKWGMCFGDIFNSFVNKLLRLRCRHLLCCVGDNLHQLRLGIIFGIFCFNLYRLLNGNLLCDIGNGMHKLLLWQLSTKQRPDIMCDMRDWHAVCNNWVKRNVGMSSREHLHDIWT
jgi:hypothetical protein